MYNIHSTPCSKYIELVSSEDLFKLPDSVSSGCSEKVVLNRKFYLSGYENIHRFDKF